MPATRTIKLADGRDAGFVDYGPATGVPVLWCHGGPGSRMEPAAFAPAAAAAGFRLIGIDRPGYGRSTPKPGRSIADWVSDALAVVDTLEVERFAAAGLSTGGAYALALASRAPERVSAVIACCALTDMRWREGKALMTSPNTADLWSASDRAAAMVAAEKNLGADGSKMMTQAAAGPELPASDRALMQDPAWMAGMLEATRHTASVVPGAKLQIVPALGHFSIASQLLPVLKSLQLR